MSLQAAGAPPATSQKWAALLSTTFIAALATIRPASASSWERSRLYDRDLEALAALYPYFCNSCLRQIWPNASRDVWSFSVDPCGTGQTWFGVGCDEDVGNPGKYTVTSLVLRGRLASAGGFHYPNPPLLSGGTFPAAIGNLTNLTKLDLANNNLGRDLPDWLSNLSHLQELVLANNLLAAIPPEIGNLAKLELLDLSNNELGLLKVDAVPESMSRLTGLRFLDLSQNGLQGEIPSCLAALSSLAHLDLSFNYLRGSLPSWLGDLTRLKFLNLQSNGFSGPLPRYLRNIRQLYIGGNVFCSNNIGAVCDTFSPLFMGLLVAASACSVLVLGCLVGALCYCRRRRSEDRFLQGLTEAVAALEAGTANPPPEEPKDDRPRAPDPRPQFPVYMGGRLIGMAYQEDSSSSEPDEAANSATDSCRTSVDGNGPRVEETEALLEPERLGPPGSDLRADPNEEEQSRGAAPVEMRAASPASPPLARYAER